MAIQIPFLDPIALQVGQFAIHWYGLSYVLGIFLSIFLIKKLDKKYNYFTQNEYIDSFVIYIILGITLGGRLGYILFYNLSFYLEEPLEIIKIWHGGMSFHGALIGLGISGYLFAKKYKLEFFNITDYIAFTSPIGIFFGRIANFVNNELVGRETSWKFGIQISDESIARHASQLYEAFGEGLFLIILFLSLECKFKILSKPRITTILFMILYGSIRFFIEFFREPDQQVGFILNVLTEGQILCVMMIGLGIFLLTAFRNKK